MKITIKLGKWSHYANEKLCYDRIYFLGHWLPFCVSHNRYAPYYRAGRSNFLGFSYQKITFLGLIILLLAACQNSTEPDSLKNQSTICPSLRQSLEPTKYYGYSTFYQDSLYLTFDNGQLKIETKPPKQGDGTYPYTQVPHKICIPDTCFLYNGFRDSAVIFGDNYQMRYRSGYPLLLDEAYKIEPQPPTSINPRKQRCIE